MTPLSNATVRTGAWMSAAVISASLALTGCTGSPDAAQELPATAAPSVTPTTASAQDSAVDAAEDAVQRYYVLTDQLLSDPTSSIDEAATASGGEELDELGSQLQEQRSRGERQAGSIALSDVEPLAVELSSPTTVTLRVCVDVSGVDVVDAAGQSVVQPGRPARSQVDVTVVDRSPNGWLVEKTASSGESCAG